VLLPALPLEVISVLVAAAAGRHRYGLSGKALPR
jgi:hypothetical protein